MSELQQIERCGRRGPESHHEDPVVVIAPYHGREVAQRHRAYEVTQGIIDIDPIPEHGETEKESPVLQQRWGQG